VKTLSLVPQSSSGWNLDGVHRRNLSAVLNIVRSSGAVTRAELARVTGLNRSTIGALVAELVELRLVDEGGTDAVHQIGRPSHVITPGGRTVALAVHPSLDAVTISLVGLDGQVIKRVRYETVGTLGVNEVVNVVAAVVAGMRDELESAYSCLGVGLAVPGLVRSGDGLVDLASRMGWRRAPLAQMLGEALRMPVVAASDAVAGAMAETTFGVGAGVGNLVYLEGSGTGIRGAVISNGALLAGERGYAGELGHTLVKTGGAPCACGAEGCLDAEVQLSDLVEAMGLPAGSGPRADDELAEMLASPGLPAGLRHVVDDQLDLLAVTVRNAVNLFNPQLIVLGGFLGVLHQTDPSRLENAVAWSAMRGSRDSVRIVRSSSGGDLVAVGAAQLVFAPIVNDPSLVRAAAG
jgi:predicted NBD/HSP70 family sugar kinase